MRSKELCCLSLSGPEIFPTITTPRMITGTVDAMIKESSSEERMVSVKLTMIMIGVKSAVRKIDI